MPFSGEQTCFDMGMASVSAELPAGGDNAVIGKTWLGGSAKDVADGACGAGPARQPRDVAVCRHATGWDAAQNQEHAAREDRHGVRLIAATTPRSVRDPPTARA